MILFALAAAAAAQPTPSRFEICARLAAEAPTRALDEAGTWRVAGGGIAARQCEGLAYVTLQRWVPATAAYEAAARDADAIADPRAASLWTQAGNAALAGGDATKAVTLLTAALSRGTLIGEDLGETFLDRGRAYAATGKFDLARRDLDAALKNVPADPLAWLLSATLARRMNDAPRAQTDIAEAAERSPDDASVALEAGSIAMMTGRTDAARTAWDAATRLQPGSPAAKAALAQLEQLSAKR